METKRLKILIASPEVVPFAKTGGLADVCGALPKALAKLDHQVKVILPKYRMVDEEKFKLTEDKIEIPPIPVGNKSVKITLRSYNLPPPKVEYLFVVCDEYYDREELYKDRSTGFF